MTFNYISMLSKTYRYRTLKSAYFYYQINEHRYPTFWMNFMKVQNWKPNAGYKSKIIADLDEE
jgi:hypothetical protein